MGHDIDVAVLVRLADRDQASVLADLHRSAAIAGYSHIFPREAPPPPREELVAQWDHWLKGDWDGGRRAFIAEVDGATVGVVVAGFDAIEPAVGHLARLYVAPESWGQGVGSALHAAAMDHLRNDGFAEATLWVLERNARARAWYERLGWQSTGERKTVYAPAGIDDLRYRIVLE
jgi:ribosomal protein S18 acetylase RimI-like enzyme